MSDEWIDSILRRGRQYLGMQMGWVARHDGAEVMRVEHVDGALDSGPVPVGTELAYQATFCAQVVGDGPASAVGDLSLDPRTRELPVRTKLGIGSYIGAPIPGPNGSRYGMLCCFSTQANPELHAAQSHMLAFIANLIAERLEQNARADAHAQATRDRILDVIACGGPRIEFQAVFNLPAMTVRGWEALSRFPPGWGGPDRWFADATTVGLGVELEMAAVGNAMAHLPLLPPGSRIGVNVSPATLTDARLIDLLRAQNPASILVEITEHDAIPDYTALAEPLTMLREFGIPTAADDTGAGYAGLLHLVELRPTGIKLDRSIVANIATDPARKAIAAAMVAFAAQTGTILLAEGVETIAELTTLYDLGITVAQGYLLHRPEPLSPGHTLPRLDGLTNHLLGHQAHPRHPRAA